ncbi:hypothetical protein KKB99_00855 [bacterium]|nr:hypothetical protein [bacterium]MBU1024535.1 hypothetical protein [bacterium]
MRLSVIFSALVVFALVLATSCSAPSTDTKYQPNGTDGVVDITAQQATALPTSTVKNAVPNPLDAYKTTVSPGNLPKCTTQFDAAKKVWEQMKEVNEFYGDQKYLFDLGDRAYIDGNPLADMSESTRALEERVMKEQELIAKDPELKAASEKFLKSLESGEALDAETQKLVKESGEKLMEKLGTSDSGVSVSPIPLLKTWDTSKIESVSDVNDWGTHGTQVRIKGRRRGPEGNWYHVKLIRGGLDEIKGWIPEKLISNTSSISNGGF